MSKKTSAFTLIELIIVTVIIAVLAAIALPNYTKAKEQALGKEALANLRVIAAAEKIYKVEQGLYVDCVCSNTTNCERSSGVLPGCNYLLKLDLNPENWAYDVVVNGSGASAYIRATAARQGSGGFKDCYYIVDGNGDLVSSSPSCTTGVSARKKFFK